VCVSVSVSAGGGLSRIVGGVGSGAFEPAPRLDFQIVDCELPGPNTTHRYELPAAVTGRVLVYCYQGQGTVGGRAMTPKQTAVMSAPAHGSTKTVEQAGGSDTAAAAARAAAAAAAAVGGVESVGLGAAAAVLEMVATSAEGFGVLIFAGAPIDEPISWRGPIVMGTLRI
jgi:redox-sensitive bicupin YhaK (pirin superfamily)